MFLLLIWVYNKAVISEDMRVWICVSVCDVIDTQKEGKHGTTSKFTAQNHITLVA